MKASDLFWALFDEGHDDQKTIGEPRVGIILAIVVPGAVPLIATTVHSMPMAAGYSTIFDIGGLYLIMILHAF